MSIEITEDKYMTIMDHEEEALVKTMDMEKEEGHNRETIVSMNEAQYPPTIYYAPLMDRDEDKSSHDRQYSSHYGGSDYTRPFLDRGRENLPPRHVDETRSLRRSQERREESDPERESKRKIE